MKGGLAAAAGLALILAVAAGGARRHDFAATAYSVLPPGQYGGVDFQRWSRDQIPLYDGLTPLFDRVSAADVRRYFKPEPLWHGTEKAVRVEHPGRGVTIGRDAYGVPHVFAKTEPSVFYGAGWAAAVDRGLLMELARGPGRLACIDAPGYDAFSVALSGRQFVPSARTEARLREQLKWLTGAVGRQELRDVDAYVAGINAQRRAAQLPIAPWTRTDVVAMTCLLGARFGAGGGAEISRAQILSALQAELGQPRGLTVWNDLRELQDPETPTTIAKPYPYGPQTAGAPGAGNVVLDDASRSSRRWTFGRCRTRSSSARAAPRPGGRSWSPGRSSGYFYPEILWSSTSTAAASTRAARLPAPGSRTC